MPITLPAVQTYASMLQKLRVRCGLHATLGDTPALNDILTEAHEYVYNQLDDGYPVTTNIELASDTAEYPWLDADMVPIARGSVQSVWIEQGDTDRWPLSQGIDHGMRADTEMRSIPERWDDRFVNEIWTLEVWPIPDQAYTLFVDYNRTLSRFSEPADVPSADYRLVLGYAVALGKAHYGKPDAEVAGQAFKTNLYTVKAQQKESRRFIPPNCEQRIPKVVKTATGFTQVW